MAFSLDHVVPWGRSLGEYLRMFGFADGDLGRNILDCAAGPSSFTAGLSRWGGRSTACDPLYRCSAEDIDGRIAATYEQVMAEVEANQDQFVWREFANPQALGQARRRAMHEFLDDYEAGRLMGRYVDAELPALPFADGEFDLALCSHFLFLYSQQLDLDFHLQALGELCRVAAEVRVFPLLDLAAQPSVHLEPVRAALAEAGFGSEVVTVPYEFQKGGNRMLKVGRDL